MYRLLNVCQINKTFLQKLNINTEIQNIYFLEYSLINNIFEG